MPRRKEVHFFDDENINWTAPDYSKYHKFYAGVKGVIAGDITPIYSYWTSCAARIKAYNPDMKLILCLRDPVLRAYSHWEMEISRKYDVYKFGAAIRKHRNRVETDVKSQHGCHRVFSYVERGFYAPQIERLLEHFPREQILFLENERMKNDQHGALDDVCDFVGAAHFESYPPNKTILPTGKRKDLGRISDEDAAYLAGLYAEDTYKTADLAGLDLSHWRSWQPSK